MVWVVSRSSGEQHQVLGSFTSFDQAERYVEQQAVGRSVSWTPASESRAWCYSDGYVVYQIERHDPPEVTEQAAVRSWQLRCAECGAEWTVTPASIIAGDDWLVCPRCGEAAQPAPSPSGP